MSRMVRPSWLLILVACLSAELVAQSAEQIQERVALGFIDRVAAGDPDATFQYILENFSSDQLAGEAADDWKRFAQRLTRHAGAEVSGIFIDEPNHMVVRVASPVGMAVRFGFDFAPDEPEKISGLSLTAGDRAGQESRLPPFEPPPDADADRLAEVLGDYLDRLDPDGGFSGAILVALNGEPIFRTARGLASIEWAAPNRIDTRFDLGSINKSFTRIAIAQLAARGELSFDDTIAKHLPDYPNAEAAEKVTIRHLLNHTSGIGDIFNQKFFDSAKRLYREPEDFFPVFAHEPLAFEPGSSSAYSNGGFMVLGAIIAAVSGKTYSEYVEESVFAPAGMAATGFFARDEPEPNVAVGYTRMGPQGRTEELRNNLFRLPIRGNSAGSAYATVDDLLAFDEALREHRLLTPAWTAWYFGGSEPGPESAEVSSARATTATGIAGGAPGVSSVVVSDGVATTIILSNYDEPGAEILWRALKTPLTEALHRLGGAGSG